MRSDDATPRLRVGLATTADELDQAFRLVHDSYVERGYLRPSASGRRITPYHAMPTTKVFVARAAARVVATVSLVLDGPLRLPGDELYGLQLSAMRAVGLRLAEVTSLAVADDCRREGLRMFRGLIQGLGVYAHDVAGVHMLCVTVHPRHARFYEALLRFRRFGAVAPYASVNGAPAVGLRLDLDGELQAPPDVTALPFAAPLFSETERTRVLDALEVDVATSSDRLKFLHFRRKIAPVAGAAVAEV